MVTLISKKDGTGNNIIISKFSRNRMDFDKFDGSVSAWRQHEPAGMIQFIDTPFNTVNTITNGNTEGFTSAYNSTASCYQYTDSSAPVSPPNVLRMAYTPSLSYGSGPATLTAPSIRTGSYTKMYVCWAMKFSLNYYGPGGQKVFFINGSGSTPAPQAILEINCPQDTSSALWPKVGTQNTGADGWYMSFDQTTDIVSRNNWHICELYIELNDPGVSNGLVKFYVDGTEYTHYSASGGTYDKISTQFQLIPSGGVKSLTQFQLAATYGGGGTPTPPPYNQYIDFDEFYVSIG